jgi:hypothetical protein
MVQHIEKWIWEVDDVGACDMRGRRCPSSPVAHRSVDPRTGCARGRRHQASRCEWSTVPFFSRGTPFFSRGSPETDAPWVAPSRRDVRRSPSFIYLFSTCNLRRVLPDESPMNVSYLVRGGVAGRSPAGGWAVGLGGVAATNLGCGRCVLASEKNKPRYCSN